MQIDLNQHEARTEPLRSQVCIIGAGIAGLTLANRLAQQGIEVALLEAGGLALTPDNQSLLTAAHRTGHPHPGTHEGRFRAFGGASLRWGGQLLPFPSGHTKNLSSRPVPESGVESALSLSQGPSPLGTRDGAAQSWPITPTDLTPHYRAAEQLLAVDTLPYEAEPFFAATQTQPPPLLQQLQDLTPGLSKWTPFSHRNMAATVGRSLLAHPRVTVYLNAQVSELVLSPNGTHIEAALVRTRSGEIHRFEASHIVIAAGTVETVRLLLSSRDRAPQGIGNDHDQLGRNFHDHLTLPAAILTGPARSLILNQLRPWIFADTLHAIKLEASAKLCATLNLNPILAHITFADRDDSGLAILREILVSRQRGDLAATLAKHATKLPDATLEALRLAISAKLHHRRFIPADTIVTLQLNAAQDAPSTSRITLSRDSDPFGLPQPIVDWQVSPNERATLRAFAQHLRTQFDAQNLTQDQGIAWNPALFTPAALEDDPILNRLDDARHGMGGACMSAAPQVGVVDTNLTVHGLINLHLASCATYPTGSPQLPTLTLMALTLRLADHLTALL